MSFLGSLGIDWKLFIIQCINFIILFLILKWFFFKPVIKILRKEKEELERARAEKEKIEKEKRRFLREREKILKNAREKARNLIQESEKLALEFRENIEKEKEEEEKKLRERLKRERELLRESLIAGWKEEFLDKKERELISLMRKNFSGDFLRESQDYFFEKLLEGIRISNIDLSLVVEETAEELEKKIKEIPLEDKERKHIEELIDKIKRSNNKEFYLNQIKKVISELRTSFPIKKEIENILSKMEIKVNLESAFPLDSEKKNFLKSIIADKLGKIGFTLEERINKNLLSGFRLTIEGFLIESNLASEIHQIIRS